MARPPRTMLDVLRERLAAAKGELQPSEPQSSEHQSSEPKPSEPPSEPQQLEPQQPDAPVDRSARTTYPRTAPYPAPIAWRPSAEQTRRLSTLVLVGPRRRLCGAWSRTRGRPCLWPVVEGRRRCKVHGGATTGPKTVDGKSRVGARTRRTNSLAWCAYHLVNELHASGRLPEGVVWPPPEDGEVTQ